MQCNNSAFKVNLFESCGKLKECEMLSVRFEPLSEVAEVAENLHSVAFMFEEKGLESSRWLICIIQL